ncbi:MAG TPA: hypothetical protein PKC39_04425 [Ferruginibacter sp.]|nr:hypothetical protein [Ferruginibacter sp.]HMP20185.1 hypothetical protein [Ferruginibacter sp.]
MKPPPLNKVLFWIIAAGIILYAIKEYFTQLNMEYTFTETKYGWYYKLETLANVLLTVASVMSFILYRKYFPLFVSLCYVGLIILIFICSINDFTKTLKNPNFFYTIRGIGTFINFGLMFYAANYKYLQKLLKIFYGICIFFIVAGIINLGKVGVGASRMQYLWAIRDFAVVLIWVFPFFFLQESENKKMNIINTGIFFIVFVFVLCTGSRSYLIIYFLYLIVKFWHLLRTRNGIIFIVAAVVIGVGSFFIFSGSSMNPALEGAFNILSERTDEDSRSSQLKEFINQWDTDYLLQGVGPLKTWYWSTIEDYYYYLDNQFLLMGWWAGLPALFVYVYLLVRTCFSKPEIRLYKDVRGTRMIIGMWILACLGFAIYVTISPSIFYYFIELMMGYHICKYSKISDFEDQLEQADT